MQRIRTSLSYYINYGWRVEVVAVNEKFSDAVNDPLLLESIPNDVVIHKVSALSKKCTSKIGLGSIALRSLWFYKQKVDSLIKQNDYQLIFFSTTQFPVCILGVWWKKKFKIPYVIDLQDPWHTEYYQDKPKDRRPPKYWFSYWLNKNLEPVAIKNSNGLMSVSEAYIDELQNRYPIIANKPRAVITFGIFSTDLQIAIQNKHCFKPLLQNNKINIVYTGRGGDDMKPAMMAIFKGFVNALKFNSELARVHFYFLGTSYAANNGLYTVLPVAKLFGLENNVTEIPDRISYYYSLITLIEAHGLFIAGSDDPGYSASKIYPFLLTRKPILTIAAPESQLLKQMRLFNSQATYSYDDPAVNEGIKNYLNSVIEPKVATQYNEAVMNDFSASNLTEMQCQLFDEAVSFT